MFSITQSFTFISLSCQAAIGGAEEDRRVRQPQRSQVQGGNLAVREIRDMLRQQPSRRMYERQDFSINPRVSSNGVHTEPVRQQPVSGRESTDAMTEKTCYFYSTKDDRHYVDHLKLVSRHLRHVRIAYSLGRYHNCELEEICTQNRDDRTAVLIRSYEFVPNYEKVTGTFYWINPKYNATVYGDKVIATHGTLDEEDTNLLLQNFIQPHFSDDNTKKAKRGETIKNHAFNSNRFSVFLK